MSVIKAQRRIGIFLIVMFGMLAVLAGRVAWIQFVEGKVLVAKAKMQLMDKKELHLPRGTIYDRNGRELAVSRMVKSLYANVGELNKDADVLANLLAPVLEIPAQDIKERLQIGGSFIWLKRTLEPEKTQQVEALIKDQDLKGLGFVEESKRYYPNKTLASQVLGFVGTDDVGLDGIELFLDKVIKGQLYEQDVETDSRGVPIFKSIFASMTAKQGRSVYLTIDSTIQFIVEQSLDKAMAKTHAKAATVIIMNPKTGEVLAMASRPTFDPNTFYKYTPNDWKNRAVSIIYEPGSTFKSIVAAAALQEGVVRPNDVFVDPGFVEVSGRRIQNWDGESYGTCTFTDILKYSVNTGFVQVGMKVGAARLNDYVRMFGFGKPTEIELPGEEEGLLFNPQEMRASDLATMSIGQSIAVTPLQLLRAVCAIGNEGVLLKPHIIKEIVNEDSSVYSNTPIEPVRQTVNPDTMHMLLDMMEKEVSEGGGQNAIVKGYRFAGKTGTAERLNEGGNGYQSGHYIASFVGLGPVEDPQVAALVVLDDPDGMIYGGQIAAPVFQEIMTQVMRYLNIRPQNAMELSGPLPEQPKSIPKTPALPPSTPVPEGKVLVPDLAGKTMREVGETLYKAGLPFVPVGSGIAVSQSVYPNTLVDVGTEVTVNFSSR